MPRSDPKNYGKPRLPREYKTKPQKASKTLRLRQDAYDGKLDLQKFPCLAGRDDFHRPGSQNPRKS